MNCGGYHDDADGRQVDCFVSLFTTDERERDEWTIRVGLARQRRWVHVRRYRRMKRQRRCSVGYQKRREESRATALIRNSASV